MGKWRNRDCCCSKGRSPNASAAWSASEVCSRATATFQWACETASRSLSAIGELIGLETPDHSCSAYADGDYRIPNTPRRPQSGRPRLVGVGSQDCELSSLG